jgi:hypothetical protein
MKKLPVETVQRVVKVKYNMKTETPEACEITVKGENKWITPTPNASKSHLSKS